MRVMQEEIIQKLGELLKSENIQEIVAEVKELEEQFQKAQSEKDTEKLSAEEASDDAVETVADTTDSTESKEESSEEPENAEAEEQDKIAEPTDPLVVAFEALMKDFNTRYGKFKEEQKASEEQNFTAKQDVIKSLQKLIQEEENIGKAFQKLNELKEQWKSIGHVSPQKYKPLQNEYSKLLEEFYYTINIYKELKEHDLKRNFELKQGLIKQISALEAETSIKKVQSLIGAYLSSWDELGPTTPELWDSIKEEYRAATQAVFNRIKDHYKAVKVQQQENLEAKNKLIEELKTVDVSGITNAKGWKKATDKVLEIQKNWKKVGFTNKKNHGQQWEEFRQLCDDFFNAKKSFHADLKGDFDANAAKKKELLDRAIELQTSTDWRDATNEYKKLQQQWKRIGPCSPREEQRLWNKFHAACNTFFESRKNHSAEQDKSRAEALEKKKGLLAEFKKLAAPKSVDEAKAVIEKMNNDWNGAGRLAFQDEKDLAAEFRGIIESLCTKAGIAPDESEDFLFTMKLERIAASSDPERQFQKERQFVRDRMNKIEASILQYENNLSFFSHANAKGAEDLTREVNQKVERSRKDVLELRKKLSMITSAMKKLQEADAAESEESAQEEQAS